MSSCISIIDLGLTEFCLDLLEYIKIHKDLNTTFKGLHAIVESTNDYPESVVFIFYLRYIHILQAFQ